MKVSAGHWEKTRLPSQSLRLVMAVWFKVSQHDPVKIMLREILQCIDEQNAISILLIDALLICASTHLQRVTKQFVAQFQNTLNEIFGAPVCSMPWIDVESSTYHKNPVNLPILLAINRTLSTQFTLNLLKQGKNAILKNTLKHLLWPGICLFYIKYKLL